MAWWKSLWKNKGKKSADIAKERLHVMLLHQRGLLSKQDLESMEKDLIEVLSKYLDINPGEIEFEIKKVDEKYQAISFIIPVTSKK
ncbi:cell division topological specificity factor MinE [bacterium 3DAC]|nr:cell division topological specificity factor MinE [Dictyoglomota bacterium]UZN22744.1 cell division topological specificity factor MinE [bacterium 3DAC]